MSSTSCRLACGALAGQPPTPERLRYSVAVARLRRGHWFRCGQAASRWQTSASRTGLDEIVTDAARGLEDTFDVNERSNTSTGKSTDGDLHDFGLRWAGENTPPSWRHDTTGREAASCFSSSSGHFLNDE
ncbi:hypothetical protein [Sterolibacterium denitrificans]|uniref:hypothetical protein n=1 Tax=Sterolibacterium denitrificans TaxID=157592 RepID=UPI0012B69B1C|nr:hypothetical protein [Sterolibacterium denitrificans]